MITGNNASKNAPTGEFVDIPKFTGVGSVNIKAINPSNEKLRSFGWTIPEGTEEPKYVTTNSEGKKSARVRFLVQIQELESKPVVAMDFWIRPDISFNRDTTKAKIIDSFGRTAWGTKAEIQAHQIPQYTNSKAKISPDYKPCHVGEEEVVSFLMKYLNITPHQMFSKQLNKYVPSKNPGHLTIDHWDRICNGVIDELASYVSKQPDNLVKVIFGVRTTEDNKVYQTFLPTTFIGNGALVDRNTGEYAAARKAIDKFFENHTDSPYSFSASPVKEWNVSATEVKDNADSRLPDFDDPSYTTPQPNDLPFSDDDPF